MINLVFQGCGILGIGYVGLLRYMEENNLLNDVKKIIGTSAGAIIGAAVAIGINSHQLEKIFYETNFANFADKDGSIFKDVYRILFKGGIYKGDVIEKWFSNILKEHTGNSDITFKEIYDKYGKELIITGTNVDKMCVVYFNKDNSPDMKIKTALRISGSIPFFYKFVKYKNDTYVDGGVLDNYPFWYFNNEIEKTIGVRFLTPDDKKDNIIYYQDKDVNNTIKMGMNIIQAMMHQLDRVHVRDEYWQKTIVINTDNISSTNFNLSNSDKNKLFINGYNAGKEYFD